MERGYEAAWMDVKGKGLAMLTGLIEQMDRS